jgi:hypothetical protein
MVSGLLHDQAIDLIFDSSEIKNFYTVLSEDDWVTLEVLNNKGDIVVPRLKLFYSH